MCEITPRICSPIDAGSLSIGVGAATTSFFCVSVRMRARAAPPLPMSAIERTFNAMHAHNLNPAQTLPWRAWYSLQTWRRRAKHQLQIKPLCALCEERGRLTPATIADHHPPHKGDYNKFVLGPLRSLCADCHNKQWAVDRKGYSSDVGPDGYPTDPAHPFNRVRSGGL
jgi:5-methylcytosine-specific restriction protein A